MATTPNRGFTDVSNQGSQYEIVNANSTALDLMLAALAAITITTADHTVTATESQNLGFKVSGALTGDHVLTVPFKMPMIVWNATSGAHTVTVKYSSDTGVVVPQGTIVFLYSDGSAVYQIGGGAGIGDLLASNNLSDVLSASTARTNLGLGTAAVADIGTGSGNVAPGDDSRFADAAALSTGTLDSARLETTPLLRSNASTTQSISTGTDTSINFDVDSVAQGTGITHSTVTDNDIVTIARAGVYTFIASVEFDSGVAGEAILWLCKNGAKSDARDSSPLSATDKTYVTAATVAVMAIGDTFSILVNQDSGGSVNAITQQITVKRDGN